MKEADRKSLVGQNEVIQSDRLARQGVHVIVTDASAMRSLQPGMATLQREHWTGHPIGQEENG